MHMVAQRCPNRVKGETRRGEARRAETTRRDEARRIPAESAGGPWGATVGEEAMGVEATYRDAEFLVEIARMYYEYGLGQQEIADRVGLSRSRISRMLARARDLGIVQVTISDAFGGENELERKLQERFALSRAVVCPVPHGSRRPLAWHLGQAAARLLRAIVRDQDTIGVTGGTTMLQVARALRPAKRAGVSVVQLEGTLSGKGESLIHGNEIAALFAKAFGGVPYFLSVPAIVEREEVKDALVCDRNLSRVLELGKEANVAVFTVGRPDRSSILVQAGYFSPEEMDALVARGAVGDLCSRFFREDGSICDAALDGRTIGLDLGEFTRKSFSIAVAGGSHKVAGIRGALRARLMNVLVTDEATARELLGDARSEVARPERAALGGHLGGHREGDADGS